MKQTLTLAITKRSAEENVKTLRKAGDVPGVIYGSKMKSTSITCKAKDLHNVYMKAGENTLVEVDMDGTKISTLIHAIAFESISDAYEHVDFYAVDMTKKVTTRIPVSFEGVAPAVKEMGGVLVTVHREITVQCLPADIPETFVIDLGVLAQFRDSITVGKLVMPKGVVAQENAETVIVTVQEPRKEEVIAPVVTSTAEGAAAGADGAAAPGADGAAATAAAGGEKKEGGGKDKK